MTRTAFQTIADALLAALVAPPCACCERVLAYPLDGAVCPACWSEVTVTAPRFRLPSLPLVGAIGPYEGRLRSILHALKYDGRRSVAPRLAALMATHGHAVLAGADVVVPVPLHPARRRRRGFNQAQDLARGLGLPVVGALRRVRVTEPQVDLPADARTANVAGAFRVAPSGVGRLACTLGLASEAASVRGAVVVLVDDVTTTGATLVACAREIRRAGAMDVRALTAARVETGSPR